MASQRPELIAVVGSGCRFPGGSTSPSSLWELLRSPRDVSVEIPQDRFDIRGYYHPDGAHHGTTPVRRSYLLEEDLRTFDATFFNISPNEADSIDPQQRLLMETVYEALESGGHPVDALRGTNTAVFVGIMGGDYENLLMRDLNQVPTYTATGTSRAVLSNRISYFFDWRGPSMTIDTACSSSMIAVHQGVQALRMGETDMAVACGATIILGPEAYVAESKMNLLSPTGRSRMWDERADGYARGEGVASVILKRLSDAVRDGDHIECVIRETGANQDGHSSTGLTVPSSEAQAALILQTYAKAGLDPQNPLDRPQYFEAHGTGTKAGDPREASAIQQCFGVGGAHTPQDPLYVGSIKTVIGHTEGAAGLAGLLKGSLALKHGVIPPNLLFNRLNPDIEQFYHGLHVPTTATPWPVLPEGVPRRVSVNSFGFGGANAHAILESYQPPTTTDIVESGDPKNAPFTPYTFSAVSEISLVALLQAYSDYLKTGVDINPRDLAWTLQSCRTAFAIKATFSAMTIERLVSMIDEKLAAVSGAAGTHIGIRSAPAAPRILGIFTGQGAQWATMGGHLIRSSALVREKLGHLEHSLATLPLSDRPKWRLEDEILASAETSRIAEAELSQPLCTAIQILLVDLLRSAGITFEAVVGHSSGEIAAAYAADFVSAHDAIRIAYYRGLYARLAEGPNGQKGAMLAVGTSMEDAQDLIELPHFRGRLTIAAHNSAASVTLSGDADAIIQAKAVFDEEKKFARMLKVDTAYHSHHMLPCGDRYLQSIRACGIRVNRNRNTSCSWYSSVVPDKEAMEPTETLQDVYWRDNMTGAVLFADAVQNAVSDKFNLALEVGPHPALKAPALQNISDVRSALPYSGVLSRGNNDIEAFSDALGFVWAHLGADGVDFQSYEKVMFIGAPPKLTVGLPSYQWNRGRVHWHESRKSRKIRGRTDAFHELLGVPSPDATDRDRRWTNLLKVSEIPWLDGHQLQGQTVFPAAGYVAMALEAAKKLAGDGAVKLYEIHDLVIGKAIAFEEDANYGIETLITLTAVTPVRRNDDTKTQTADFSCYSCPNAGSGDLELAASGRVKILFGTPSITTLSSAPLETSNMVPVDADDFYSSAAELGYHYTGSFRTMSSLNRRLDKAFALVSTYSYGEDEATLIVHPTMLDVAFQALLLAYSSPGDQAAWALHVPTSIRCIRVNPELFASLPVTGTQLPICAALHHLESTTICGSVDIFSGDGQHTLMQAEDLAMKPFSPATAADDRQLFTYTKWDFAMPNGNFIVGDERPSEDEVELATLCERLSYYYLRKWNSELTDEEWANGQWHHRRLRNYMNHTLSIISSGKHPYVKKEWSNDTPAKIQDLVGRHSKSIDIKIISAAGENLPASVRGQTTMLEHLREDNMMDEIYKKGIGFAKFNSFLAKMVQKIVHRYPHAKILEVGAGTGGTTKTVLESIGNTFFSYTYTDISAGFFPTAAEDFKAYGHKMAFKVFDAETTPASQGFEVNSYDIVIAANVIHATSSLQRTLENTRRLLKPGGYLLLFEITTHGVLRFTNSVGGLSGWWVGEDDGRQHAPTVTPGAWHNVLQKSGFSGVDTITPKLDDMAWPFSIIATQAINDQVDFLRRPLSSSQTLVQLDEVAILGTGSLETSRIAEEVADHLRKFCEKVVTLADLPTEADTLAPMTTVINLVDLDYPIFKEMTPERMGGMKRIFEGSKNILWITRGAHAEEPYHMASIGFGRTMRHEFPYLSITHLDLANSEQNISKVIAECLLRQCAFEGLYSQGNLRQDILWSPETEFCLDNGQLLIPRVVPDTDQNDRLNALRRTITKKVSLSSSVASISQTADRPPLLQEEALPATLKDSKSVIRVHASTLMAVNIVPDTFTFVSIGVKEATMEPVVALSGTNSSRTVPLVIMQLDFDIIQATRLLAAIAGELLAVSLVFALPSRSSVLVHEPGKDRFFAMALARRAAAKGIHVTFSTASTDAGDPAWAKFDAWTPKHVIRRRLPTGLTHFLDLNADFDSSDVSLGIADALPLTCRRVDASDLSCLQSRPPMSDEVNILSLLEDAVSSARTNLTKGGQDSVIQLGQIGDVSAPRSPTTVIDWTSSEALAAQVAPLDAGRLFSRDKTYLLVGLTGQIGQSICEWMVRNGAGYIFLTSRRPNVDAKWLESFDGSGATVKVCAMDISNKQDLKKVVDKIKATCPPIAGVANAAMVLHDILFTDMSLDMMEKVLQPKIDGSNYLDELFYNDPLDFFVMFSSVSCIFGNPGQSSYAAACAYMGSLAHQRRKRGVAASTFDIGRVVGIGYVERAGSIVKEQLVRYGYKPIAETDFHHVFAETIRSGYPSLGARPVVTTGMSVACEDDEFRVPWFDDPRFSHCIVMGNSVAAKQDDKNTALPVSEQLSNATTMEEALEIIKVSLSAKLQVMLQMSDGEIDLHAPVIDLGIDSLVAVEVRSWFVKELKVDMPVLKVLGGGSISDLSQQALQKLPEKLLVNIGTEPVKPAVKLPTALEAEIGTTSTYTSQGSSSPDSGTVADNSTQLSSRAASIGLADSEKLETIPLPLTAAETPLFLKSERLSFAQSRFWFLRLLLQDQTTFNITFYYKVTGNLRVGDLDRAIRAVGSRHEALRTCFIGDEIEPDLAYQKITESSSLKLEQKKISCVEDVAVEYENLRAYNFDIEKGDTMRVVLLSLSPSSHYILFNYHHIAMDGVSFQVFLSDLEKAYNGKSLGPFPRQCSDFSKSQREAFERGEMNDALRYWRGIFHDKPPVLPLLPMARMTTRMLMDRFEVHQVHHRVEPALAAQVKRISKAARSTPFHLYLAAFKAMLFRFTDPDSAPDLTIGIADANRNDGDILGTLGLFLNLLTLRFQRPSRQRFIDAITEARNTTYAALANSSLPFDVLLEELNVPRSSSHSPFFQAFFDYRQGAKEKHAFGNCQFEVQEAHPGRTGYDITLDVTDNATGALVTLRTQTSLYDKVAADLLLETYIGMLEVLSRDASIVLEDTPLFSEKQLTNALVLGRGPHLTSGWPETLPHRIDQIAETNGNKIAIMDGIGQVITYTDLIRRVEAISEALQNAGVGSSSRVLVFQQATADWVCSMLAIMRVGGVYVPLDLRNPLPRLAAVARDCQPWGILMDATTLNDTTQLNVPEAKVINVSRVHSTASARVPNRAQADAPAAILYTSGTTGTPKGIIIRHSGLRNEIEGYTKTWKLGAERVLQQSAFTFNHSSDQMYTGLANGGMVYVVPWSKRGDPLEISKIIREYDITYTKATPSEYSLWLKYGLEDLRLASHWRFAFGGGESLTSAVIQDFKALNLPQLRFFNSYGPAEISISSTKMEIAYRDEPPEGPIACGYSLPNYVTYILDEQLKPVPAGMSGEIVIGGAGVSLGYLNNRELTNQHFVPNPYSTPEYIARGWTRMYRTGDIGHLEKDGALVFHSRMAGDTQIKIRGIRIELSDIERNILSAADGALRETVVTLRKGDPDFLVAHVVFAPQHAVTDIDGFLQHLLGHLPIPQYMIPVIAVPLDRLPLSSHSKVDRKAIAALPLPQRAQTTEDGELNETMLQLKQVWQDVLGNRGLGFNLTPATSFFFVGGNSLLIVRLQSRIRDVFNVVVRLVELLGANSLGEMARLIEESGRVEAINWDTETMLHDLGTPGAADPHPRVHAGPKTVLVTGATGFLAQHLLPQLVANPNVSKIHCVAVRSKAGEGPRKLAIESAKVVSHAGDLSLPRLGLSESAFKALSSEVDVILHMGATRSFWDSYHVLRASNVSATKELVKLAIARRVPIHYISSAGVLPRGRDAQATAAGSVAALLPATDGSDGYVASRWASERVLERAAQSLGLSAFIHRFVPAERPSPDSTKPMLDEFVRFVDVSGLMPERGGWEGRIDLMPAEEAANVLCAAVVNDQVDKAGGVRFTHHESQISIDVAEMITYVEQQRGQEDLERIPGFRWVGRIKALGFRYLFTGQEVSVQSSGASILESRR